MNNIIVYLGWNIKNISYYDIRKLLHEINFKNYLEKMNFIWYEKIYKN